MKRQTNQLKKTIACTLLICGILGAGNLVKADTVIDAQPITTESVTTTEKKTEDSSTEKKKEKTTEQTSEDSEDEGIIQGWNKSKTRYYEKSKPVTGVKKISGELYYFDNKGKLYEGKGLRKIGESYYYFKSNHTMKTGVVKIKKKRYYFRKKNGARYELTGIRKVEGKRYCFNENHQLKSGWTRNSKGKRYYFDKKTYAAKTGWNYIGKYKYYFAKNGQLCQDLRKKFASKIRNNRDNDNMYKIMVNRDASCVTVYAKDGFKGYTIPVVAFVCSAGRATPTGTFHIRDKLRWHELMGPCWGQWCEHLTEDILFHSVYYNREHDNRSLDVGAYNKLGTVASHGCIRMTAGDCKWVYDNCAVGTTVRIYDDVSDPGPFDKPEAQKLSSDHTWDPTDPNVN